MRTQYTLTCEHCNQPFTNPKRKQRFCGKSCVMLARGAQRRRDFDFWSMLDRTGGADSCWLWQAATDRDGYGRCHPAGFKGYRAHRVAYTLAYGPIPDGLWVLHRCDNPRCCNPAHLWLGTNADNSADMVAKGRQARGDRTISRRYPELLPRGEQHPNATLTEDAVREMRALRGQGWTYQAIATRFAVVESTAISVVTGKTWRHVRS